jgi:hypothetical protein
MQSEMEDQRQVLLYGFDTLPTLTRKVMLKRTHTHIYIYIYIYIYICVCARAKITRMCITCQLWLTFPLGCLVLYKL